MASLSIAPLKRPTVHRFLLVAKLRLFGWAPDASQEIAAQTGDLDSAEVYYLSVQ